MLVSDMAIMVFTIPVHQLYYHLLYIFFKFTYFYTYNFRTACHKKYNEKKLMSLIEALLSNIRKVFMIEKFQI